MALSTWGHSTYLRVSLLLQVEQEKQLAHQALLRADSTVRAEGQAQQPLPGPALRGQLGPQLQDPQRRIGTAGKGAVGILTVTLDHMAAAVADIPEELRTRQMSSTGELRLFPPSCQPPPGPQAFLPGYSLHPRRGTPGPSESPLGGTPMPLGSSAVLKVWPGSCRLLTRAAGSLPSVAGVGGDGTGYRSRVRPHSRPGRRGCFSSGDRQRGRGV